LNFNGRDSNPGLFDNFVFSSGFANGLITFQFDPDYGNNGKFYTVHMETPSSTGLLPNNTNFPGFNTAGYTTTASVDAPGSASRRTVLIQWTDTNINNDTFEGTAREMLRMDMSGQIHPMGDLIFNPVAGPGDPDWRVMYISIGDGGAGEQSTAATRLTPQRLDALGGKILRIIPDLDQHTETSTVSPNGRYRIPNDNPYTSIADTRVRDELFAVGLRNPHRMSWDVDPSDPASNHLIVDDIGLHTWEEVNIVQPGRNFGYSQREGNEVLQSNNLTVSPLPRPDVIPVQITDTVTAGTTIPTYPVAQYGHDFSDSEFIGDSISSGYVYRGSRIPELYGKYIFGEITTGQIFYCELDGMLAADDGDPATMATIHSLDILWDNPLDSPDAGMQTYSTVLPSGAVLGPMFQIAERAYELRGGLDPNLPGSADVTSPNGRADIRIQIDETGELYILSKSDGIVRAIVGTASALEGDYNRDGRVDVADYIVWRKSMGQNVAAHSGADGSGNGTIDEADYDFWRARFGNIFPGGAGATGNASVPEPAAVLLMSLAALWVSFSMRCHHSRVASGK
jgi:glucose/sorbosone dehydrogenase